MSREPIRHRISLPDGRCLPPELWGISRRFQRLFPSDGQVAHALRTLPPVAGKVVLLPPPAAPRLACVKPAASVHPEPGSNSSLYNTHISSSTPTTYSSFLKKRINALISFSVLVVLPSVFSMNLFAFLFRSFVFRSERECKGRHYF